MGATDSGDLTSVDHAGRRNGAAPSAAHVESRPLQEPRPLLMCHRICCFAARGSVSSGDLGDLDGDRHLLTVSLALCGGRLVLAHLVNRGALGRVNLERPRRSLIPRKLGCVHSDGTSCIHHQRLEAEPRFFSSSFVVTTSPTDTPFLPAASLDDRVDHVGAHLFSYSNRNLASKLPGACLFSRIPLALVAPTIKGSRLTRPGAARRKPPAGWNSCAIPHRGATGGPQALPSTLISSPHPIP